LKAVVLLLLTLAAQTPQRTGVIEGYVVRARTDPPAILVNARLVLELQDEERVARTDSNGRFLFTELPAGRYRLRVTKDGYLRQEFPRSSMGAPGLPIDLAAGQEVRNIVFRLDRAPSISGVIRDVGNALIANVVVQALKRGYDSRGNRTLLVVAATKTDDRGNYRLYWLDTGEYFICAVAPTAPPQPPQVGVQSFTSRTTTPLASTYYPGFPSVDDAKPVRLQSDRDAYGMDFALTGQFLGPVYGAITSLTTGQYVAGSVTLTPAYDVAGIARFQTRSVIPIPPERNNYSIPVVPPGAYILTAISGGERASRRIIQTARGIGLLSDLQVGPGNAVRGRLTDVPNSMDLRAARISLVEADEALPSPADASVAADRTFAFAGVQPGRYSVSVSGLPGDLYARGASFAGVDVSGNVLTISDSRSDPGELAIQVGIDGSRITGTVFDGNNMPFAGAQLTLVPEGDAQSRPDFYRTTVSALDGAFTIRGIVPGDYKLFGWDNLEPNAYLNVDYMRSYQDRGTSLRIGPSQSGTVSLPVIQLER
jgi:hypothetical protein